MNVSQHSLNPSGQGNNFFEVTISNGEIKGIFVFHSILDR